MKKINRSNYRPGKGSKTKGKSLTLQNEALTVAELFQKHLTGKDVQEREGVFLPDAGHDDEDGEKFFKADLADREEVREGIKAMQKRLKALEKEFSDEMEKRAKLSQKEGGEPQNEK